MTEIEKKASGLKKFLSFFFIFRFHTSYEYKSKGIWKDLFQMCAEKARDMGTKNCIYPRTPPKNHSFFMKNLAV